MKLSMGDIGLLKELIEERVYRMKYMDILLGGTMVGFFWQAWGVVKEISLTPYLPIRVDNQNDEVFYKLLLKTAKESLQWIETYCSENTTIAVAADETDLDEISKAREKIKKIIEDVSPYFSI
ncbi:MAG: hypothetical protein Q8Q21_00315 [bacterium]|nr:hypothetical protein [bacterium]